MMTFFGGNSSISRGAAIEPCVRAMNFIVERGIINRYTTTVDGRTDGRYTAHRHLDNRFWDARTMQRTDAPPVLWEDSDARAAQHTTDIFVVRVRRFYHYTIIVVACMGALCVSKRTHSAWRDKKGTEKESKIALLFVHKHCAHTHTHTPWQGTRQLLYRCTREMGLGQTRNPRRGFTQKRKNTEKRALPATIPAAIKIVIETRARNRRR